ncbi:hypothetical protein ACFWAR_19445 [Streptomyces sp. NPDC059917]|uniref:hypothetical protein n=1 Tax=Streptomyces sp. NPDC059917 TaxID=3347002 RepID=UPI00364F5B76
MFGDPVGEGFGEPVTYWAWAVTYDGGWCASGTWQVRGLARLRLEEELLPRVLGDLGRFDPGLRGLAHRGWSATELSARGFRARQARELRRMVDAPPPGPVVPPAAVVGLLVGVCLLVLAAVAPPGSALGWLLSSVGVLCWIVAAVAWVFGVWRRRQ